MRGSLMRIISGCATSALDVTIERVIEANLRRLSCTQISIAHRLSTVRDADLILVLEHGRIVEHGSHEELLKRKGSYAQLIQDQSAIAADCRGPVGPVHQGYLSDSCSRGQFSMMTALGQFNQMTVGVTQEGPYLVAPVYRGCQELGSARVQYLVSGKAVRYANVQLAANHIQAGWRPKGHSGLISGGASSNRQQQFAAPEAQETEHIGNLAYHLRPQHVAIEGQRADVITRHKQVSQFYTGYWKVIC